MLGIMTAQELRDLPFEPSHLPPLLVALWCDSGGHWDRAHHIAQDDESPEAAWVHAYLHRKEGDEGNARHWYTRAGQPVCNATLEEEWTQIAETLLAAEE